ncbi:MAG TPA: fibronectin type III domain-containing protein [Steroidobacteraceae bacterium]|jgi:hypothetical protein
MSPRAWHRFRLGLASALVAAAVAFAVAAPAAEQAAEYEYDELGRLKRVVAPDKEIAYTLDPAGNRNALANTNGQGWPSSIAVPASSATGDYTVSWGASTGPTPHHYELFEATSGDFINETKVYNSTGLSLALTAKPDDTYYYRVRSCVTATSCGPRRYGANPILVQRPPIPGVPGTMTIPASDIDGAYTVSWVASTGTVTAYELYQATNAAFTGQSLAYSGATASANLTGRGNGTYYYRVRACNTSVSCSGYRTGGNAAVVTLPPGVPGAATVPATYTTVGTYTVSWTASTGVVTAYELLENTTSGESLIYSGTNLSFPVTGRAEGSYSYRLRACNGPACSAYTTTAGNGAVVLVDQTAPQPPTTLSRTGQIHLFWSGGSTDSGVAISGVDRWRVYRSGTLVGTVLWPAQSFDDTAAPSNQTYTYTVRSVDRAGNQSAASTPLTVFVDTLAPAAPTGVSAVAVNSQTINVSWNAAVDPNGGTITGYFLYRDGGNQRIVTGTSYSDSPLAASTTYTYTVKAYDSAGNVGPLSAPASATTPATALPQTPLNLRFDRHGRPLNTNSYDVVWDASPSPPTISYYVLEEVLGGSTVTYTINSPTVLKAFVQSVAGTYSYRVKSCTAANVCSAYTATPVNKNVCVGASCNQ